MPQGLIPPSGSRDRSFGDWATMLVNIKALFVAFVIGVAVFWLAKPIALKFMAPSDFVRRRNLWLALTAVGFLAPSIWWFSAVAAPLIVWGARKDTNPVAFYLSLLLVIPPVSVDIPFVGVSHLFQLNIYRLLAICVLVPTAWRLHRAHDPLWSRRLRAMDLFLLAYGVVVTVIFIPPDPATVHNVIYHDTPTNLLRRAVLFLLDVYVLYYVVSRFCTQRRIIAEALAAFCLACALLAPIAVFESVRHWLLYAEIGPRWGVPLAPDTYFIRDEALRAQATAGHSIALGYLFALALGCWLYLRWRVTSTATRIAVAVIYGCGLLVTYARGPWLGAIVIYFTSAAIGARAVPRLFKAVVAAAVVAGFIAVSPLGERIVYLLPYVGAPDAANTLLYRQRLAERAWELFQVHPFFGQQLWYLQMQDLRQGQGIIDFVNTYAQIALFYGGVGLATFLAFILIGTSQAYRAATRSHAADSDLALMGRTLIACTIGTLLVMTTCSLVLGIEKMLYVLVGIMGAYAQLAKARKPAQVPSRSPAKVSAY
jgi:hypothetical protein